MKSHGKFSKGFFGLVLSAVLLVAVSAAPAREGPNGKKGQKAYKVAGTPSSTVLDGNDVTNFYQDNGLTPYSVAQSWCGEFPRGSGVGVEFQEGVVVAGLVYDGSLPVVRAEGATYSSSMQAGRIIQNAQGITTGVDDPSAPDVRIWRVRSDISPTTPTSAIPDLTIDVSSLNQIPTSSVTSSQLSAMVAQYQTDWKEWPADKGAPWYVDSVGILQYNDATHSFDPSNVHDIPGVPGATQTIWFVCNDINPQSTALLGSPPTGIEEQTTLWDYASSTPLNDIFFQQAKLIYKGTATSNVNSEIDSCYITQWRDPDVGDYSVELSGSDSSLGIGFGWSAPNNSKYVAIGLQPPATGLDFLQGPSRYTGNPSDSAVIDFQWRHGYRYWWKDSYEPYGSQPSSALTGYAYFAAGSNQLGDPDWGHSDGAGEYYNLCKGYLPYSAVWPSAGTPIYTASQYASTHGIVTNYVLPGDPVTGTGWIDGIDLAPSDRRDLMISGPFTWKLHDTIEVVTAEVDGMGVSNTSSVAVMKYNVQYAQYAFANLFKIPSAPLAPQVTATALNDTIVLDWGNNQQRVQTDETTAGGGFAFEGYNVYQLPSPGAGISTATRVATYDVKDGITTVLSTVIDPTTGVPIQKPVEFGTDSGIKRFINISQDAIRGGPLVNGQSYYYAVTAYSVYHQIPGVSAPPFSALESAPVVMTITPHSPNPGTRYLSNAGDTLSVAHSAGFSDGIVVPQVVDPSALTGHTYKITFDTTGGLKWSLTDVTDHNSVKFTSSDLNLDGLNPVVGGVEVSVSGPSTPGAKDWNWVKGTRKLTWAQGSGFGLEDFNGAFGYASPYGIFNSGNTHSDVVTPADLVNIAIYFATTDNNGSFSASDTNVSYGYRYLRNANKPPAQPSFAPYIKNSSATYAFQDYTQSVPLAVYNIQDPAHPARLAVGFMQNNVAMGEVNGEYWPPDYTVLSDSGVDNAGDATSPREWLFIFDTPYTGTTPDANLEQNILQNDLPVMYMATWCRRGDVAFSSSDEMVIDAYHVLSMNDVYGFTAPAPVTSATLAAADVQKVNVFPNPYYGWQYRETNALNKQVTFNHLPAVATIRIYNLGGVLVRTIYKNDNTQFATWDLRNESDLPVASGIYIIYVDMGKLGTKILKFAMVQQQQVLPVY